MGLVLLLSVGALFGWLASIVGENSDHVELIVNLAVGSISAVILGAAIYDGSLMTGISPAGFVLGGLGSIVVLALTLLGLRKFRARPQPQKRR
ncbi:GlsB/YeaQ/YmgE family stress response membrane protein [Erythrobacter sp. HKB08]|uniref:GlsB/YeaQ/YmgE family stress response membrane protein n=1 Tax=Erythrobacter sp. HKB08 TaxID=2502843 RepID=UPI0010092E3C|nr:hypothetical protein [Erythrobacter sp. HKB08]